MRTIALSFVMLLNFSACYFNPVVNHILAPVEQSSDPNLGLLALGGGGIRTASIQVSGQIKDLNSVNIVKPVLLVSMGNSNSAKVAITESANGNNSGKFLLQTTVGTYSILVSNSNGNSLGKFILKISSDHLATVTAESGANFIVTNILTHDTSQTVTLSEDPTPSSSSSPPPSIISFSPTSGCTQSITIIGNNFSTNSNDLTVTGSACTFGSITSSNLTQIVIPLTNVTGDCTITVTKDGQSGSSSSAYVNLC